MSKKRRRQPYEKSEEHTNTVNKSNIEKSGSKDEISSLVDVENRIAKLERELAEVSSGEESPTSIANEEDTENYEDVLSSIQGRRNMLFLFDECF